MPLPDHPPASNERLHHVATYYTHFAAGRHLVLEWLRPIRRRLGSRMTFNVRKREMNIREKKCETKALVPL
jgi:hypothetical protein